EKADLFIDNGRIVAPPAKQKPCETYDVRGKIIMAGAVDIHSPIAGAMVTMARLVMPQLPAPGAKRGPPRAPTPAACSWQPAPTPAAWSSYTTGIRYAEMGYTTVIEPAVSPIHAIEAQRELSRIPIIDVGSLAILGNDDFTLGLMHDGADESEIGDYVAWTLV